VGWDAHVVSQAVWGWERAAVSVIRLLVDALGCCCVVWTPPHCNTVCESQAPAFCWLQQLLRGLAPSVADGRRRRLTLQLRLWDALAA
jgi:hypothetical protein